MTTNIGDLQKLADLLNQLGQKLTTLSTDIAAWQVAQSSMDAAVADANAVAGQINALDLGVSFPPFSVPVQVDPAWVESILDNAAKVQAQGDALRAAIPPSGG